MKNKGPQITLLFLAMTLLSWSQQENRLIRQGNRQYDDGNYKKAEIDYIKSTQSDKASHKGFYNLGDAWYMQKNYLQASAAFDTLRTFKMDDETRSKSYYNLGNSLLKAAIDSAQLAQKVLPPGIEAYKQSLRLNPADTDAKYNLAYAQKLLDKSQQQQQQQQNKDKQDKKDDRSRISRNRINKSRMSKSRTSRNRISRNRTRQSRTSSSRISSNSRPSPCRYPRKTLKGYWKL